MSAGQIFDDLEAMSAQVNRTENIVNALTRDMQPLMLSISNCAGHADLSKLHELAIRGRTFREIGGQLSTAINDLNKILGMLVTYSRKVGTSWPIEQSQQATGQDRRSGIKTTFISADSKPEIPHQKPGEVILP